MLMNEKLPDQVQEFSVENCPNGGVSNGTSKNVGLGKFWQNLESGFDKSRSLMFAWFDFYFFESRNILPRSLGFLTRISASRGVSNFTIRHPKMGTSQKLQNSIQTLINFWPVYPIHTNSLFWVIFVELPFCHFPPPNTSIHGKDSKIQLIFHMNILVFQTSGKQPYSFPVLSRFYNGLYMT